VKISIIIPVYNERPILAEVVRRVVAAPLPPRCQREVIVVDDGSTDGSGVLLDREFGGGDIVVHHSARHIGKGSAVRAGIARASGDVIIVQDGDLEYDPGDYHDILKPIVDGTAAIVYGSRFQRILSAVLLPVAVAGIILGVRQELQQKQRMMERVRHRKELDQQRNQNQ